MTQQASTNDRVFSFPLSALGRGGGARSARRMAAAAGLALAALGGVGGLAGCEVDNYFDPSVTGRWEYTPAKVPVLSRLVAIEGPESEGMQTSPVTTADLVPEIEAYRLGPGDGMVIEIQDFLDNARPEGFQRVVDPRGFIDLPQLPSIFVNDFTVEQVQERIARALREADILQNAVVSIQVLDRRRLTYHVVGAITGSGEQAIPKPDFRLLEALSQAGSFDQDTKYVYIVRQIALTDEIRGRGRAVDPMSDAPAGSPTGMGNTPARPGTPGATPAGGGESFVDLIDELAKPKPEGGAPAPAPAPDPAPAPGGAPANPPAAPSPGVLRAQPPAVDLPEGRGGTATPSSEGNYVFLNGQWVQVNRPAAAAPVELRNPDGTPVAADTVVTQRILKVPLAPLLAGDARFNPVIRPGDIIRVPSVPTGLVYLAGEVNRPGPINLPLTGELTLLRAINAAGGLSQTAIPERVDLLRRVGDRQAWVRVNLRAIAEGTHPDIIMKSEDYVNVGTNFFAFPLAVFKNGLRASYGFGFVLDRNFQGDVFGIDEALRGN